MVTRKGGSRRKSRAKFTKHYRRKGKISLTNYFQQLNVGDNVALVAEPAVQKSMYRARFHGKMGKIAGTQGSCYKVTIADGGKQKTIVIHPVHLKRV
jgi:large subunit ribosomal protein L21e